MSVQVDVVSMRWKGLWLRHRRVQGCVSNRIKSWHLKKDIDLCDTDMFQRSKTITQWSARNPNVNIVVVVVVASVELSVETIKHGVCANNSKYLVLSGYYYDLLAGH